MPAETYTTHVTYTASGGTFLFTTPDLPDPSCTTCGDDNHTVDECPEGALR